MYPGIFVFGLAALAVIVAFIALINKRRSYTADEAPEDQLSDEEFRRIEFGDDI